MFFRKDQIKKELRLLDKRETKYANHQKERNTSILQKKLAEVVPDKLQDTLDAAFIKAFGVVFEKGTGMIEKTYNKTQHEQGYKINAYAVSLEKNKKNLRAFSRQATGSKVKNILVSGVEGVGLGLLGIGIPDIPLFTAVLLKSIYEVALSYGFSYDSEEEQQFVLKVIEVALLHGEAFVVANDQLNQQIASGRFNFMDKKEQMRESAKALSEELLYMKFLQGIPIVGAVGGLADSIYLKQISEYADLKYKRRFYMDLT